MLSFARSVVLRVSLGFCLFELSTLINLSPVTVFTYSPKPRAVSQSDFTIFEASFLAKLSPREVIKVVLLASLVASTDTLYVSLSFAVVFPTFTISPSPTTSTEPLAKSLIVVLPASVIFVKSVLAKFVRSDLSALLLMLVVKFVISVLSAFSLMPSLFCQEVTLSLERLSAFTLALPAKSAVKFVVPVISLILVSSRLSL